VVDRRWKPDSARRGPGSARCALDARYEGEPDLEKAAKAALGRIERVPAAVPARLRQRRAVVGDR